MTRQRTPATTEPAPVQTVTANPTPITDSDNNDPAEVRTPWLADWSALWAGALASIAALVVLGLIGVAVGAHVATGPENRLVDLKKIAFGTLAYSVFSAFLAFALGGWVTGRVAGNTHSEPAMLHGALTWLLALPLLVTLAGLGAGSYLGGWHAGLAGTPSWAAPQGAPFPAPTAPSASATTAEREAYTAELTDYRARLKQWNEDTPRVVRNSALGALTALLLGLMGAVLGGWLACGEPMNPWYVRPARAARLS